MMPRLKEDAMDYETARRNMVESQIRTNKVTHSALLAALAAVPRERFVPAERAHAAYVDEAVPLAPGRYLMEPMTFARLVQLAEPKASDHALLVGSATGYGAAVLAPLVKSVVALEGDGALAAKGREQLARLGVMGATQVVGALDQGWARGQPYDLIILEGSAEFIPAALFDQLAEGGRLVAVIAPVGKVGRAILHTKQANVVSHRTLFDASAHLLPGFAEKRGFVF
jgi:protein-L-isoaspartate(D-aspartate) O-methyltransferase